jgi:hypothetical protein
VIILEAMKPIAPPKLGGYTGKGFLPGQSGNPGGRMKIPDNIKDAFRKYTLEAIETLAEVMRTGRPADRIRAAEIILERAYGKFTQMLAGDPEAEPADINIIVQVVE